MSDGQILSELRTHDDGACVAYLTVDRPARLNALDAGQCRRLAEALDALSGNSALRAVVLTGGGERAFIGGADLDVLGNLGAGDARRFITAIHEVCTAIRTCPVPVLARINGYCLGAGMEIAAACDLRIAAREATFAMPEVQVGVPSVIEAALLPGLIGWGRTRWLLLTGQPIDAATAERWGFIEQCCPGADLDASVEHTVAALLSAAPGALRAQKALMTRWESLSLDGAIAAGIDAFEACYVFDDEPARYVAAFKAARAAARGGA